MVIVDLLLLLEAHVLEAVGEVCEVRHCGSFFKGPEGSCVVFEILGCGSKCWMLLSFLDVD
jgi:hypothetical protein